MHHRLVGVPPSDLVLGEMAQLVAGGDPEAAVELALENPHFCNTVPETTAEPDLDVRELASSDRIASVACAPLP